MFRIQTAPLFACTALAVVDVVISRQSTTCICIDAIAVETHRLILQEIVRIGTHGNGGSNIDRFAKSSLTAAASPEMSQCIFPRMMAILTSPSLTPALTWEVYN